jgi:hypothetical protein
VDPNTSQGRMFGDHISTSVRAAGNAYPGRPDRVGAQRVDVRDGHVRAERRSGDHRRDRALRQTPIAESLPGQPFSTSTAF